jgi:hypothetical protein
VPEPPRVPAEKQYCKSKHKAPLNEVERRSNLPSAYKLFVRAHEQHLQVTLVTGIITELHRSIGFNSNGLEHPAVRIGLDG